MLFRLVVSKVIHSMEERKLLEPYGFVYHEDPVRGGPEKGKFYLAFCEPDIEINNLEKLLDFAKKINCLGSIIVKIEMGLTKYNEIEINMF